MIVIYFSKTGNIFYLQSYVFYRRLFWNSLNFESYQIGNFLVEKELLDIFQLQTPELVGLVLHLGSLAMLEVA
jgi:hypothetical protein